MAKLKIAVLFGGVSKDYHVSCRSAYNILVTASVPGETINRFDLLPIGITRAGRWLYFPGSPNEILDGSWEENPDCCSAILSPDLHHGGIVKILPDGAVSFARIDAILPVLHGKYGECGRIQSLCKLSGVPLIGSDYAAANACTDKIMTHLLLNKAGIKTADYLFLERDFSLSVDEMIDRLDSYDTKSGKTCASRLLDFPVYVKASSCSSSIGANIANDSDELSAAIKIAFSHDQRVIIEELAGGREFLCAVYGNEYMINVSEIGEIVIDNNLSVSEYIQSTGKFMAADLNEKIKERVKLTAKQAFKALGCKSYALVKLKLVDDELYCTGVDHLPGLTENSAYIKLTSYNDKNILEKLVELL